MSYVAIDGSTGNLNNTPVSFDVYVDKYFEFDIQAPNELNNNYITRTLSFNFESNVSVKGFIHVSQFATFSSSSNLQFSGNPNVKLLIDDNSRWGYTFLNDFVEYVPENDTELQISIWNPALQDCANETYCLYPNEILKHTSSLLTFSIFGDCSNFTINLADSNLHLFNRILSIDSLSNNSSLDKVTIIPTNRLYFSANLGAINLIIPPTSPSLLLRNLTLRDLPIITHPIQLLSPLNVTEFIHFPDVSLITPFFYEYGRVAFNISYELKLNYIVISPSFLQFNENVTLLNGVVEGWIHINYKYTKADSLNDLITLNGEINTTGRQPIDHFIYTISSEDPDLNPSINFDGDLYTFNNTYKNHQKSIIQVKDCSSFHTTEHPYDLYFNELLIISENETCTPNINDEVPPPPPSEQSDSDEDLEDSSSSKKKGLSKGAIVGIVLACVFGAIIIVVAIFVLLKYLKKDKSKKDGDEHGNEANQPLINENEGGNDENGGNEDE